MGINFRKHKFLLNKFLQLTWQKILNLEELIFAIEPCIANFAEFILASSKDSLNLQKIIK